MMVRSIHRMAVYDYSALRGVEIPARAQQMGAKLAAFAQNTELLEHLNELRVDADGNVRVIFVVPKITDDAEADERAIRTWLDATFAHGTVVGPYRGG